MEGLGWWIYLCSVAGGILTVSLIFSIVFLAAFLITSVAYYNDECELRTAKKWRKYTGIIGIISVSKPEPLRLKGAMDFTMRKLKVNSPLGNSIGVLLGIHF